MTKMILTLAVIVLNFITVVSCSKDDDTVSTPAPAIPNDQISTIIPSSLGSVYTKNFNRYVRIKTPNGGSIHIVAQDKLSNEQILRCKNILKHYLNNYEGSKYGSDKSAVANKMAENNAILCLLNGQDDGKNPIGEKVSGQPLYQNEIQVEGGSWYMNQNYTHRDASFEEILHFVHDNGIGVDENGKPSPMGASPVFQAEIRAAQKNALSNKLWGAKSPSWIKELTEENSLSQEYLAAVIDSYYGLWGAWKESSTHGMWGEYVGKTRADIQVDDPMGFALMNHKFFHPYLTYNARIHPDLNGNFSLKFNASKPYTHHSQYLKDVTLLGANNNSVTVNQMNNHITGNSGSNTVIFLGKKSEYTITTSNGIIKVKDNVLKRDGENTLKSIEKLQFSDQIVEL